MIDLHLGDCLEVMPTLAAQSFDAIIADIPYSTTDCKWDTVIPFAPMWEQLKRLAKPKAAIVLFGSQPFTSALVMSNVTMFKHEWIWDKGYCTGHLTAKTTPMKQHESIVVFCEGSGNYYPQKEILQDGDPRIRKNGRRNGYRDNDIYSSNLISVHHDDDGTRYPKTIIRFLMYRHKTEHPTQKPVALMEYLIRTYTNEGDAVLDFTMGSGTTMVACVNTKRNGTGIEKDAGYYAIAERRVKEAQAQMSMAMVTPCPS